MNDCIWDCTCVCEGVGCFGCKDYISVNSDMGNQMLEAYERDVEVALRPVRDEWARKMGAGDE